MGQTICAIATPSGLGAISVIRISGDKAFEISGKLFSSKSKFHVLSPNTASFFSIYSEDNSKKILLDQVVAVKFASPHSFTGEDVVEISCHGSPYIQRKLLEILVNNGCRMAFPGEFTQRAFLNGKFDLPQAEAIADLIEAQTERAHSVAMKQLQGGLSGELAQLRDKLLQMASLLELELDFGEEDVEFADRTELLQLLEEINAKADVLIQSYKFGNMLKSGIPVAIVGEPNVGKSSLLNAILRKERAIVSDIPGTTRDTVEDTFNIGGLLYRFIDTAGIRTSDDVVENLGIERSLKVLREAAIVLHVFDAANSEQQIHSELETAYVDSVCEAETVIKVVNKCDLLESLPTDSDKVYVSAKSGFGLDNLLQQLEHIVADNYIQDVSVITNERHYSLLCSVKNSMDRLKDGMQNALPTDLLAEDLRTALHDLGEITGTISTEDILNNIFGKFCIGK